MAGRPGKSRFSRSKISRASSYCADSPNTDACFSRIFGVSPSSAIRVSMALAPGECRALQVALQSEFTQVALDGDEAEHAGMGLDIPLGVENRPSRTAAATIIRKHGHHQCRQTKEATCSARANSALSSKPSTSLDQSTAGGLLRLMVRSGTCRVGPVARFVASVKSCTVGQRSSDRMRDIAGSLPRGPGIPTG
jgi:hypothetical protein